MAINKILDQNRNVILDLTTTTVDSVHLSEGYTAYNKYGQIITGTLQSKDTPISVKTPGVFFYDFFGKLIHEYTKEEFMALEAMPELPELKQTGYNLLEINGFENGFSNINFAYQALADYIVPSSWTNNLAELKNYLQTHDAVAVGPQYSTIDNSTILFCVLNDKDTNTKKSITLYYAQTATNGVEIDWGDGSTNYTSTKVYTNGYITVTHEYPWYSHAWNPYIIKFKVKNGHLIFGNYSYKNGTSWSSSGTSSICSSSTLYNNALALIGGDFLKLGYLGNSISTGILCGWQNIDFIEAIGYSASTCYYYYGGNLAIYNANYSKCDNLFPIHMLRKKTNGKIIIPINAQAPNKDYWLYLDGGYNIECPIYFGDSWIDGHKIQINSIEYANYLPRLIYPEGMYPNSPYAMARQELTDNKVNGYLQAGIATKNTGLFSWISTIKNIRCPANGLGQYPNYLFYYCSNLTSVICEDDCTALSDYMFYSCYAINYIYLSAAVETIGNYCFLGPTSSSCVIEIEPNLDGRHYGSDWISTDYQGKIYYNGTISDLLTELSRGNQDSGFIGFYNFCYVLDNAGTVIYNNKKYSLAADLLPNYFIIDPQITTLPLSIFSFWNPEHIVIPQTILNVAQADVSTTKLVNLYYKGTLDNFLDLIYGKSPEFNPMYYAEHLFILDTNGTTEFDGEYYKEVTTLTVRTVDDGKRVGNYACCGFRGGIKTIILPEGITSIGEYAFYQNAALDEIILPNSLVSIGQYAFNACTNLKNIIFKSNLTSIGNYSFRYCTNLSKVTFLSTTLPSLGTAAFRNCPVVEIENHTTTVITPSSGSSDYGYLRYYLKNVITDPNSQISKLNTDEYGNILYIDGSTKYAISIATVNGVVTVPANAQLIFSNNSSSTNYFWRLSNNATKIILPTNTTNKWPSSYFPFRETYHCTSLEVGDFATSSSMSLNSPYHLYIRDIKLTGNSYIYPLTNYKARYTTPKIGIIKENITNLTFYLNLYAHYLNVKQLYFENSSLPINWNDSYISESSARTLDLLDLSGRPINFNSSSASFIFGGSSASTATSMINTVIKLNCNSNFPANNNFGILKYSINTTKLVLTGTGLTSITNNILYGDIPQLEEIVFPESLSSISGSLFMKFLISGNRRLIMTFTRATPATMTSTIEAGSGISASNLKIRVPQGSLSAYTSATNYPDPSRCIYVEYDPVTGEDIISE